MHLAINEFIDATVSTSRKDVSIKARSFLLLVFLTIVLAFCNYVVLQRLLLELYNLCSCSQSFPVSKYLSKEL